MALPTMFIVRRHCPGTTKVWGLRFDLMKMKPCLSWTTARALPCRVGGQAISHINGQIKGTVCWDATTQASDVAEKGQATWPKRAKRRRAMMDSMFCSLVFDETIEFLSKS